MIVGIDPGKEGAIVCIGEKITCRLFPLIGKEYDRKKFAEMMSMSPTMVGVEDVHAMPGVSASANWSLSQGKEMILTTLTILRIPFMLVQPKEWQAEMFVGVPVQKKATGRRDTKAMALIAVKRLFPDVDLTKSERSEKPHEGIVDALLIGEYTRRRVAR